MLVDDLIQRQKIWVDGGHALSKINIFMIPIIHGLGQIDCKLIRNDLKYCELISKVGSSGSDDEAIYKFNEHSIISYLWVLGGYEIIRSIDEIVDKHQSGNPNILGDYLNARVKEVKKKFERLRVPLAKFEPSRAHKDTDFAIAYPYIHKELGLAWRVSEDSIIIRRELSDKLLDLLLAIHDHILGKKQ